MTTRKRNERLQDVPLSVSAVSGEIQEAQHLDQLQDFALQIPNFTPQTKNPRSSSLSIRGVGGVGGGDGSESGAGYIVDNVFYTHVGFVWSGLYDIRSVEVARGPQGTLLGKNTTVGAVVIRTNEPTFTPENYVEISGRNYDGAQIKAVSDGALIDDTLAYRLSYYQDKDDGWVPNQQYPRIDEERRDAFNMLNTNRKGVRGQLLFKALDGDLTSRLIVERTDSHEQNNYSGVIAPLISSYSDGTAFSSTYASKLSSLFGITNLDYNPYTGDATNPSGLPSRTYGISNELNWDVGDYTFTSVTAYRRFQLWPRNTQGYFGTHIVATGYDVDAKLLSQEFRLASKPSDVFDWQVGIYGLHDWRDANYRYIYGSDAAVFYANSTSTDSDILDDLEHDRDGRADTVSGALFGQGTIHFTPRLDLTLGARYTHERRKGWVKGYNVDGTGTSDDDLSESDLALRDSYIITYTGGNYDPITGTKSKNSPSWLVNPSFKVSDDFLVYASVAQGQKSGAVNTDATPVYSSGVAVANLKVITDPEKALDYELGFKSAWLHRTLTVNAGLYWNDIKDYQGSIAQNVSYTDSAGDTTTVSKSYLGNIPKVRLKGVELETNWTPIRTLHLYANGAITGAEYVSYAGAAAPLDLTDSVSTVDLSGTRITSVPRFTATVGFDTNHPAGTFWGGPVEVFGYANESAVGKQDYSNARSSVYFGQGTYYITNAGLGLRRSDSSVSLSVWAKNLFDEKYFNGMSANSATAPATVTLGDPRTFGATLALRF
ncbi:MAG: TonB-dependent receptor [Solimonas sp.]